MPDKKITKPDVVIRLSPEQLNQVQPLKDKQSFLNSGMILGSVGLADNDQIGDTVALSYIPQKLAEKIRDLVYEEMGEK